MSVSLVCGAGSLRGLMKDNDFGLERRDCQTVAVVGSPRSVEEVLYGGGGVDDEEEIVDVEKDTDEGHEGRVVEDQVGVVPVDGVYEVGDVETPQEEGDLMTFFFFKERVSHTSPHLNRYYSTSVSSYYYLILLPVCVLIQTT